MGVFLLLLAASIPAYFVSVDKEAVVASGKLKSATTPLSIAKIYFDGAKFSTAILIESTATDSDALKKSAESIYKTQPTWRIAGGDEPFFDAFQSTIFSEKSNGQSYTTLYSILALEENRKKLLDFLSHSKSGLVGKFIELRKMSFALLPPVFSSAGGPLDSALLTSGLLAQTGDFSQAFLKDLSATLQTIENNELQKEKFEKYCIGLLSLLPNMDWTTIRSLVSHFNSQEDTYNFAKIYKNVPTKELRDVFVSGVLISGAPKECSEYLASADTQTWQDFTFAFLNGDEALRFLVSKKLPIYRPSFLSKQIEVVSSPIKSALGGIAINFSSFLLVGKIILSILGGYLLVRGVFRLFQPQRDTVSWLSPLALIRGLSEGVVVSLLFFLFLEPDAFKVKVENASAPELKFAFEKVANTIKEESMKFESDTATLAAVGLFFVLQFTVYILGVIRLSVIRRTVAPAKLKLKLLENEDNLFDLGLYIGLAGTVVSLILLTMGVVTASLMAAYASTLFGILFTATIKIVHVRKFKRQLLFDAENEN